MVVEGSTIKSHSDLKTFHELKKVLSAVSFTTSRIIHDQGNVFEAKKCQVTQK